MFYVSFKVPSEICRPSNRFWIYSVQPREWKEIIINHAQSSTTVLIQEVRAPLANVIPTPTKALDEGFKYLGFFLNPDGYRKADWDWLSHKIEARISFCANHLLSRGGILVLLKVIFGILPDLWNSIEVIPKGVLTKIRKLSFQYLRMDRSQKECILLNDMPYPFLKIWVVGD
jgi:hypothetical protein